MAKAVIGKPFTFTGLFLDSFNNAVDPLTPTIDVFYYDDAGVKVNIVPSGTVLPPQTPPQTGRFTFTVTIPSSLDPRFQVYGLMQGVDPVSGFDIVIEQSVDLFAEDNPAGSGGAGGGGLFVSFTKPGQC